VIFGIVEQIGFHPPPALRRHHLPVSPSSEIREGGTDTGEEAR